MEKRTNYFSIFSVKCRELYFFIVISFLIVSCQDNRTDDAISGISVADVISLDESASLPVQERPRLVFGPRKFSVVNDLKNLSGPGLVLLQGGEIRAVPFGNSLLMGTFFNGGRKPLLESRVVDGVIKPLSTHSLMMLSALYQFDSFLSQYDSLTGERPELYFSKSAPLTVYFHPSLLIKEHSGTLRQFESNNAAYVSGAKQFALFKTASDEKVPLNINPQILSHELGHAIFEFTFFGNKYEMCEPDAANDTRLFKGRLELEFAMRGLNEGFADFFSFVWSGSSNVLEASVGVGPESAERNFSLANFNYESVGVAESGCHGGYYCIGTLWSKSLYEIYKREGFDPTSPDQRRTFFRELVSAMKKVGENIRAGNGAVLPETAAETRSCQVRDNPISGVDDELLGSFFREFVQTAAPEQRKFYCETLDKHFGRSGFPVRYRSGCL
ncbi:MAG: hypothetical protein RIR26_1991 [Pseudomonadota bacterium]|jgi:hypothetical protein